MSLVMFPETGLPLPGVNNFRLNATSGVWSSGSQLEKTVFGDKWKSPPTNFVIDSILDVANAIDHVELKFRTLSSNVVESANFFLGCAKLTFGVELVNTN